MTLNNKEKNNNLKIDLIMGTLQNGMKELFQTAQTTPTSLPTCGDDGTPTGHITAKNLANLLGFAKRVEFVDMGLPSGTLWASKNLGAENITDYGAYFSWGNVIGKKPNGTTFAETWGTGNDTEPYVSSEGAALTGEIPVQQDAANFFLGGNCRMPSNTQYAELFNSSYTKYIDAEGNDVTGTDKLIALHGVKGIYLKSKINGNTLFFPCAGYGYGTSLYDAGSYGHYWARSLYSATSGYRLHFHSGGVYPQDSNNRYLGFTVRAVQ